MKKTTSSLPPLVQSGDTTGAKVVQRRVWQNFFHTCKAANLPLVTLGAYILLNAAFTALTIYIPQVNADFFTGDASVKSITLFLGVELLSTVVGQGVLYVSHLFRMRTNRNLRNVLWGKLLRLKPAYYDRVSSSTLLSRITVDTDSLNAFVMDVILGLVFEVYAVVLTITEMSSISMAAAIRLLVFVPIYLLFSFILGRLNFRFENAMKFKMSDLTDYLSELMASMPIIKAFNQQDYETRRGRQVVDDYYRASRNVIFLDIGKQIAGTLMGILPDIAIITMGIHMLQNSTLTPAGWYVFYIYAGTLITFTATLGSYWEQSKAIQGQLNKVSAVLMEEEEGLEPYVKETIHSGDIVFDGVTFCYGESTALDHVSFTLPCHRTTAIVGYSGAGKSTILKLLERMYEPTEGRILVAGKTLSDWNLRSWRENIAFVPQNSPMISGTIRENLLYGVRRTVSDKEIMAAAKLAYVDSFIQSLPEGLDYEVGQFGSRLSGGQRQKLSIARAILTGAETLILDEPTASLDMISAEEVAKTIEGLRHQRTILLVAHQAGVIRGADHVVVLDSNHHATEGTHKEMLVLSDFYARLMQE